METTSAPDNAQVEKANQLLQAGDRAWQRADAPAALENWTAALEHVKEGSPATDWLRCLLHLRTGAPWLAQGETHKAQAAFEHMARLAERHGFTEHLALARAWLARVAYIQRDLPTAMAALEEAEQRAQDLPAGKERDGIRGLILYHRAEMLLSSGDFHAALEAVQEAQAVYHQAGEPAGEAGALTLLGKLYVYMRLPDQALVQYQAADELYQQSSHDPVGRLSHQLAWGAALETREQNQEALERYQAALEMAHHLGAKRIEANCLSNIAVIRNKQGRYEEALSLYQQALALFRALEERRGMAVVLNNMGAVYIAQGSGQQALSALREARQMAEEVNFRPMLPETYALLSAAQRLIGNFHAAFDLAEKALQMAEEVGSMEYAAVAYRTLGRAAARLEQRGDLPFQIVSGGAESYFATSLEILEQVGSLYERARSLQAMGEHLKQTGKPERQAEAETYLQQAADLFERVGLSART